MKTEHKVVMEDKIIKLFGCLITLLLNIGVALLAAAVWAIAVLFPYYNKSIDNS